MKHFMLPLILTIGLCQPITLCAQEQEEKDDSYYLVGAVPEVGGKVVFTKEFTIPGMSAEEIYTRVHPWMDKRLKQNENNSRILISNKDKGVVAGTGTEWLIFKKTALILDRATISYLLTVDCVEENCTMTISRVKYTYKEGEEKHVAEELISDEYALNKKKDKMHAALAKWRRFTVDLVDAYAESLAGALSKVNTTQVTTNDTQVSKANTPTNKMVISMQQPVIEKSNSSLLSGTNTNYKEIIPEELSANLIQPANGKLVISIGNEPHNMTTFTANAGGSLGKVEGKSVIFTILSPDQSHEQMDKTDKYIVRFYPNDSQEASVILQCKKRPTPTPIEGMPRTYIGEIVKAEIIK